MQESLMMSLKHIDNTLTPFILQLISQLENKKFNVGNFSVETAISDSILGRWSFQFLGIHLRYRLVIELKRAESNTEVAGPNAVYMEYALYELVGTAWEPIELPHFDTISPFDITSYTFEELTRHIRDLDLQHIPVYISNGSH